MNLILDTHALIWWLGVPGRLSKRAEDHIADPANTVWVSAASAWEIATKIRLGRLPESDLWTHEFDRAIREEGFGALAIAIDHAVLAGSIEHDHRDPFDRMLAAQSRIDEAPVVTSDPAIESLGAAVIW